LAKEERKEKREVSDWEFKGKRRRRERALKAEIKNLIRWTGKKLKLVIKRNFLYINPSL